MGDLTAHFSRSEFDSNDGAEMPTEVLANVRLLAEQLEILRERVSSPIKINSGYRSPFHNKAVGGAAKSQHLKGTACDITIKGMTPNSVHTLIEILIADGDMKQGGLGRYNTFTHYDIRGTKARW